MASSGQLDNRVKARRLERGWSQADLAGRAGISRAAVSAIEIQRLVPSVATALALATAFDCTVEDLFGLGDLGGLHARETIWAWPPTQEPCRYWHARVGNRTLLFPVEATGSGVVGHDGIYQNGCFVKTGDQGPEVTLVMASCDPAAGLLATEIARSSGFRLLVLPRPSRQALDLLGQGLVLVAGVHLTTTLDANANRRTVHDNLGPGYRLLRVAQWQEGLSIAPTLPMRTVRSALRAKLRWVGREPGSAARQCLDELRQHHAPLRRLARDHRGVAEAIRCGWADIGICHRLASDEAGLQFLLVREENYDLCFAAQTEADPRIQALIRAVRSISYRRILGELPGFDTSQAGELQSVS